MDRCERCKGPIDRTEDDRFVCPRCGIWVHLDGAELGPPISEEQAKANFSQFVVGLAEQTLRVAKEMTGAQPSYDGLQMDHEDGWVYEYVAGKEPRRVRRSTSAKDPE